MIQERGLLNQIRCTLVIHHTTNRPDARAKRTQLYRQRPTLSSGVSSSVISCLMAPFWWFSHLHVMQSWRWRREFLVEAAVSYSLHRALQPVSFDWMGRDMNYACLKHRNTHTTHCERESRKTTFRSTSVGSDVSWAYMQPLQHIILLKRARKSTDMK